MLKEDISKRFIILLKITVQLIFNFKENISVVYGGSVKLDNCGRNFSSSHVDGLLIGGASLDPEIFLNIYNLS